MRPRSVLGRDDKREGVEAAPDGLPAVKADYTVAGSTTAFVPPGDYGSLDCGCWLAALPFDPAGPCLLLVMKPKLPPKGGPCPRELHDLAEWGL